MQGQVAIFPATGYADTRELQPRVGGRNAVETIAIAYSETEETFRITQLQAGSEEAFDRLVAEFAPSLYRLACRLLNDPADAADVVQEVFLKVFRSIGQFQGTCSLKGWLYRITVNTVANQNRWWRRHREPERSLDASETEGGDLKDFLADENMPTPFQSLVSRETQELVQTALARLTESSRTILVLREMEGLSYEEVAEILHLSLGTVKSRLARARQSLKEELEAMLEPAPGSVPAWTPAD
ncbi:MAG: sigma-70 family RNA polymerase sigma factor [Acidobacteria bacterium]|nr:sigma-70 family RNA polymerase sigma factor [Acidobacteriota bacterium]